MGENCNYTRVGEMWVIAVGLPAPARCHLNEPAQGVQRTIVIIVTIVTIIVAIAIVTPLTVISIGMQLDSEISRKCVCESLKSELQKSVGSLQCFQMFSNRRNCHQLLAAKM